MYRQGDVLLTPVAAMPGGLKKVPPEKGRRVLAHGEATGHAHTLEVPATEMYISPDGEIFVSVKKETALAHQEHDPITLPAGDYKVTRQREYTPTEIIQVRD